MKGNKIICLLLSVVMVVSMITIVAGAEETILWNAEDTELDVNHTALDTTTFSDRGTVIKDNPIAWSNYNAIKGGFAEPIINKKVKLSFDFMADSEYLNGTPSFYVKTFNSEPSDFKGTNFAQGFYAYDSTGSAAGEGRLTYYGNSERINSSPVDSDGNWVNGNKANVEKGVWYHIDTIYDLNNKTATYYADGQLLGTATGPEKIYGIAVYMVHAETSFGITYFDNFTLTEFEEDGLTWTAETEAKDNSFLLNFSQPVEVLVPDMVKVYDMETRAEAIVSSIEKNTSSSWRVNLVNSKANAEYKVELAGVISDFGATTKTESLYVNTSKAPKIDAVKTTVDYNGFSDMTTETMPSWWSSRNSGASSGTAGEYSSYFIEDNNGDKRLRIQNAGNWIVTGSSQTGSGGIGIGIPLGFPDGTKKMEIEFDAAYHKDTTLLPADTIRAKEKASDATGAFGAIHLDVDGWYKHVLNIGSEKLYAETKYGSNYSQTPISTDKIKVSNDLTKMNHYKLVFHPAEHKLDVYCDDIYLNSIQYDGNTKLVGLSFMVWMTDRVGTAAEEDSVFDENTNVMVVDNIIINATYDDYSNFGVKSVRYGGKMSNNSVNEESLGTDDFSGYTAKGDAEGNKENAEDFEIVSGGRWSRVGHSQTSSWWGYGTYVNKAGRLEIDNFHDDTPISLGVVRKVKEDGSAVNSNVLKVKFDAAFNTVEEAGDSAFVLYADDYPVFTIDRTDVYLYDEQLQDEKLHMTNHQGGVSTLNDVELVFDFAKQKIRLRYDQMVRTTNMYEELAADGFSALKFYVNRTCNDELRNNNQSCTFVMDDYSAEILAVDNTPVYFEEDSLDKLAPTASEINIEFTDAVKEETTAGIAVTDADGNAVAYTKTMSEDGKTLTLAVKLEANEEYKLIVPETVASANNVANSRAYTFSVVTDDMIKFINAEGNEYTEAELANVSYATVELLSSTPSNEDGKCAYIYAIYDKATDDMKSARFEELPYLGGDVLEHSDVIELDADEYAKVFVWDFDGTMSPLSKMYIIGK